MRTAVCIAVRRTSRMQSTADVVVVVDPALNRGSRGWSTMPAALSTLSPSKKVLRSTETARRNRRVELTRALRLHAGPATCDRD
jgi:hypothetical protein